jgi:hypothetical protein
MGLRACGTWQAEEFSGEEDGVWSFFGWFPIEMVASILENTLILREIKYLEGFLSSSLARGGQSYHNQCSMHLTFHISNLSNLRLHHSW